MSLLDQTPDGKTIPIPEIGSYHRALVDISSNSSSTPSITIGTPVVVTNVDDSLVYFSPENEKSETHYRYDWRSGHAEFAEEFEPLENAEAFFAEETARLMREMGEVAGQSDQITGALSEIKTHVDPQDGAKALVPAARNLAQGKKNITKARNDMAKLQLDVKQKRNQALAYVRLQQKRMQALFDAKQRELEAKLGDLKGTLELVEEAIGSINLYLGKDEQIVQIAKGKPAPADTKISIRQLVLYADEECVIDAEDGGIDFEKLDVFDEWVVKPKNRHQVFPEAKGLVAIKPRRTPKKYEHNPDEDPTVSAWVDAEKNKANLRTYFLLANGENLYRICTSLSVRDHLVPKENEYDEVFFWREYNFKSRAYEKEPIYPGDRHYMDAMKTAEGLKKHYLKIVLFLQGLLDRTAVFAPLPVPRLNILNRAIHTDHLVFINDAEKLLGTGRPPFWEWLANLNKKLDVGHRIVGAFSGHSGFRDYYVHKSGNERLRPPKASSPKSLALHTLESREGSLFWFKYDRTDEIDRWNKTDEYGRRMKSGPSKRRASCGISPEDRYVLNFDNATVEDMEFYLGNRTDRHEYVSMFPLLKTAIAVKKEEDVQEEPFRNLLVQEVARACKLDPIAAEPFVRELISWWKLKNRTHRALVATDDAKAHRMIVAEAVRRKSREGYQESLQEEEQDLLDFVRNLGSSRGFGDLLCIGHRNGREYSILHAADERNVFAHETVIKLGVSHNPFQTLEEKQWIVIERRRVLGWRMIYESDRWPSWKLDAHAEDHLTGPEFDLIASQARDLAVEHLSEHSRQSYGFRSEPRYPSLKGLKGPALIAALSEMVICLTKSKEDDVSVWFFTKPADLPANILTEGFSWPMVSRIKIVWKKKRERSGEMSVKFSAAWHVEDYLPGNRGDDHRPWSKDTVLPGTVNETLTTNLRESIASTEAYQKIKARLKHVVNTICQSEKNCMAEAVLAKKKAEFLAEYEHEELWDDHKKSFKEHELAPPQPWQLRDALEHVIEKRYVDTGKVPTLAEFEGKTFRELLNEAKALGWKWNPKKGIPHYESHGDDNSERDLLPYDSKITYDREWDLKREAELAASEGKDEDHEETEGDE